MRDQNKIDFARTLIITYIITCVILIASIIVQYNIRNENDNSFYNCDCENYLVLSMAKMIDALIPTTITFALTLSVSAVKQKGFAQTVLMILLFSLAVVGIAFITVKTLLMLGILMAILTALIIGILLCCNYLVDSTVKRKRGKSEKHDGKLCF